MGGRVYVCAAAWGARGIPAAEGGASTSLISFKTNYVSVSAATLMKWPRRDGQ